jgi:intein/homing endonuclease
LAGSGKTCIAAGVSADFLRRGLVDRIIISRPCVGSEDLGYLPGDFKEKIDVYLQPLYTELEQFINVRQAIAQDKIKILPVSYMRGVTFKNSFVIIDECFSGDVKISTGFSEKTQISTIYNNFNKNIPCFVLSLNEKSLRLELKKVKSVFKKEINVTKKIFLDNRRKPITCTVDHPFYIIKNNNIYLKNAEDLNVGDSLLRIVKEGSHNALILDKSYYDIWLGFVLGGGCISPTTNKFNTSYRLSKNHEMKQYDYMIFCKELLSGIETNSSISGYTGKPICGFRTSNYFIDKDFINTIYKNGQKITKEIEKYFTERTLALWYMDDGSVLYDNNGARFHTGGFSLEENNILKDLLKDKFDIDVNISQYKDKYYYLSLNYSNKEKLFNIIRKYIPSNMSYKINTQGEDFTPSLYNVRQCDCLTLSVITNLEEGPGTEVYNIEVEDNNNYFANNILVHNCQNLDFRQLKLILSRFGSDSKMVLTGDISQSDLCSKDSKDFVKLIRKLTPIATPINKISIIELKESVRHPLIKVILDALED